MDSLGYTEEVQDSVQQILNSVHKRWALVKQVKQLWLRELSSKLSYNLLSVTTLKNNTHTTHSRGAGNSVRGSLNKFANLVGKSVGKQGILSHQCIYDWVDDFVTNYTELVLANLLVGSRLNQYVDFIVGCIVVAFNVSSALLLGKSAVNRLLSVVRYKLHVWRYVEQYAQVAVNDISCLW